MRFTDVSGTTSCVANRRQWGAGWIVSYVAAGISGGGKNPPTVHKLSGTLSAGLWYLSIKHRFFVYLTCVRSRPRKHFCTATITCAPSIGRDHPPRRTVAAVDLDQSEKENALSGRAPRLVSNSTPIMSWLPNAQYSKGKRVAGAGPPVPWHRPWVRSRRAGSTSRNTPAASP